MDCPAAGDEGRHNAATVTSNTVMRRPATVFPWWLTEALNAGLSYTAATQTLETTDVLGSVANLTDGRGSVR